MMLRLTIPSFEDALKLHLVTYDSDDVCLSSEVMKTRTAHLLPRLR